MAIKKDSTELIRQKVGDRLKEMLNKKGITQAELLRRTSEAHGSAYSMLPSHLSEIIHGKRSLPKEFAFKYAEVLGNIDAGYLIGMDQFIAKDYSEYLYIQNHSEKTNQDFRAFHKYDGLLYPLGFSIEGYSTFGDAPGTYDIKYDEKIASIPATEMDHFLKDVNAFIVKRMEPLMQLYSIPDFEDLDKGVDSLTGEGLVFGKKK